MLFGSVLLAACGSAPGPQGLATSTTSPSTTSPTSTSTSTSISTTTSVDSTTTTTTVRPSARPLAGIAVGLDPGHNGDNWRNPTFIDRTIWNGRAKESCDTAGTATNAGYPEAQYNWNVAVDVRRLLVALGARVVMTRSSNLGVGPCVTTRATILDRAHVDVAVDIHADGGPPGGRGFAILVPVRDAWNHRVITTSLRFAHDLRTTFRRVTKMPWSTYDGVQAIQPRSDLAGLNLTTVPKVLIECGNMRNATDAALLVTPAFQRVAARAIVEAIGDFLGRRVAR